LNVSYVYNQLQPYIYARIFVWDNWLGQWTLKVHWVKNRPVQFTIWLTVACHILLMLMLTII